MTPTVTSNYLTDRLYSLFYVSGSIDSFLGDEMRRISKYLREITTKFHLFIVYKQPFHKMPVWTQILL